MIKENVEILMPWLIIFTVICIDILAWYFYHMEYTKHLNSDYTQCMTYRRLVRVHKRCEDGQVITFTRCQNIIGLTRDKPATAGLPKCSFSGPPKYAPCVGCSTSWDISLHKITRQLSLNENVLKYMKKSYTKGIQRYIIINSAI